MFETLRTQHEQQGAYAQVNLLLKALQIELTYYEKSIRGSVAEIRNYYRLIVAKGKLKEDDIFAVILLNSMGKHFGPLQQTIIQMSSTPGFNSEVIATRLLDEDTLIRRRVELGQSANPYMPTSSLAPSSAFAAVSSHPRSPRPISAKCKRDNKDYCISPGGKMAGRIVDEARRAFRAV
ncbi:hypothetical protein F5888DRAFT_1697650, partial [Russula emetica]